MTTTDFFLLLAVYVILIDIGNPIPLTCLNFLNQVKWLTFKYLIIHFVFFSFSSQINSFFYVKPVNTVLDFDNWQSNTQATKGLTKDMELKWEDKHNLTTCLCTSELTIFTPSMCLGKYVKFSNDKIWIDIV